MLEKPARNATLLASDFESFKRQESTFIALNVMVLSALLLIHSLSASHWGNPSGVLLMVLSCGLGLNVAEFLWLRRTRLGEPEMLALTWASVGLNMLLAFVLAALSDNEDTQYFALMIVPVLKSAFRFSLRLTMIITIAAGSLDFLWVWNFFRRHPPVDASEYFEAGTMAMIYIIVGFAVWELVDSLRRNEEDLARSVADLKQTRERLLQEEKLSAVGRFSSAIAHEIRHPVAVICSSLSTAMRGRLEPDGRQEMFEIAAREATRLEKLTGDFLTYAKPKIPVRRITSVADLAGYVADICRTCAAKREAVLELSMPDDLVAEMDVGQMQQALLNLVINAIEASPQGGLVKIRGGGDDEYVRIDIENANGPIPAEVAERLFEPFFSNKPGGTGLGLSIARSIVLAHGGELELSRNDGEAVCFSVTLPVFERAKLRRRG